MPGPWYFAWAGGTIQDQVTVVTNGNTHGGVLEQVSVVGDLQNYQLVNIASTQSLDVGALYGITGPLLAPGTFFVYDTSVLVGAPGSVNIVGGGSGSITSATFTCTKWTPQGTVIGVTQAGSSVVAFTQDLDLVPGQYYGISGGPIGQTPTPLPVYTGISPILTSGGTGITVVSSAYFLYTGSLSANMKVMVATPTIDSFLGMTTGYTVSEQEVTAFDTGEFPVLITGPPDGDWNSITSIPLGILSSLAPGLRYNISGNGIQVGSTFIAPAGGATSLEMDLPASTAQIAAILTITGPRTPSAPFDPSIHDRFDEQVISFEIEQQEGNFATLTIDLKNPAVGLLAVGRNLWCWLSYDTNWSSGGSPAIQPIFTGRLVGVPKLQAGEVIQLQFLARPDDFNAQKVALASSLQVLPYYDPVWLAANVNPDTVLEAYSALFHVDRVSLGVTVSDILQGEDGTVTIGEDQAIYDAFSLSYGQPPITALDLSGTVSWTQEADGLIDITTNIANAFRSEGSPWLGNTGADWHATTGTATLGSFFEQPPGGQLIGVLNGSGLFSDWPKAGTQIGQGWSLSPLSFILDATYNGQVNPGGWLPSWSYNVNIVGTVQPDPNNPDFALASIPGTISYTYTWAVTNYLMRMVLRYEASRERTETVSAVLVADVQRELSDTSEGDKESVSLTSDFVSKGVDQFGAVPIGVLSRRSYFQTDRGALSLEYLLLLARAKMRARARSVDITLRVDFATALGITLRNSIVYLDRRLPGGTAAGKVKSYKLTVGNGVQYGDFTIGCSIGNGNPITAASGVNSYVEDNYVDRGYQIISGQNMLLSDELAYETLDDFVAVDDGIDFNNFTANQAVEDCFVTNGLTKQLTTLSAYQNMAMPQAGLYNDPNQAMAKLKTTVTLVLKPVTGSQFHTDFYPAVSLLALPKTIDLSAAADIEESLWDVGIGGATWDAGSTEWDCPPSA